jgi:hypothetical protein
MLPPDKENNSIFSLITESKVYQSIKGLVRNPYDETMIKKYCSLTIEAMFFETYFENREHNFNEHHSVLKYIQNIHNSINRHFRNAFTSSYYYATFNDLDNVS